MRVLVAGFAVFALLVGLVWLVGALLPATREGRAESRIEASAARVLAVIADVEAQPEWRAGLSSVTRTATGWTEVTARGERIDFETVEMSATRIRLNFRSDAGYFGEWQADLTGETDGTRISVVERATVPRPFARILARLFFDPDRFAATYLGALKSRAESE